MDLLSLRREAYLQVISILVLTYCFNTTFSLGQSYPYKFNYLTVDEGLSHADVNDIAQDGKGYIWIATNFGIDRYDGYSIKKFYNSNLPVRNAFKNRVMRVYPDRLGYIWLTTEDGLQRFDSRTEKYTDFEVKGDKVRPVFWKLFKSDDNLIYCFGDFKIRLFRLDGSVLKEQNLKLPPNVRFYDMAPSRNGVLHFVSSTGVWKLSPGERFKKVTVKGLPDQQMTRLLFNDHDDLLISVGKRLFLTGKGSKGADNEGFEKLFVSKQFTCEGNKEITGMIAGRRSDYWINTGSSLVRLDQNLNFIQTVSNKSSQHSLNSNVILRAFIDRSECLWVGTSGGGLNYCDLNQKLFYTLQHDPANPNSLSGNYIRSVLEDGGDLWIGTNANGLNLYNLKTQKFTHYNTHSSPVKLRSAAITALTFDNDHNLWIGSPDGLEIIRPDKKTLWKPPGYEKFPRYLVGTLAKDYYGNIWFGNLEQFGVIWKDKTGHYHVKTYREGHSIFADRNEPQLFVSSRHGLKQIIVDSEGNINKTFRYAASSKPNSLSSSFTSPVARQNDSIYWVGTMGGGLNRISLQTQTNSFSTKSFGGQYGIFNDVEGLEIDNTGKIWMSGNGLERLDPITEKVVRYDKNDGLQGNSFKVRASHKGVNGRLYFGGINGLNYFFPNQITTNSITTSPVLTDILINNKTPSYGDADSNENTIAQAIGYSKEITLDHLQNNFAISFSAMHYANPLKCRYRYQLVGFDDHWNYTDGKNPTVVYNNLGYDRYNFIVEASNNDGIWSGKRTEIAITVTPPWWKSDFAKTIYIILTISVLAGLYIYQARWYRLKREIELRAVNEKKREEIHKDREELYEQQLTFFTNISHEFRTPLTLILGPLESLISQNENSVLDKSYQLMLRNAKRLTNLISELMNFKKVADSLIKLQVQPLVTSDFFKDIASEFEMLAKSKDIHFQVSDDTDGNTYYPMVSLFDSQILEKILLNLLNNAFKYTQPGGRITFEIFTDFSSFKPSFEIGFQLLNEGHRASSYLYFKVADSGVGISADTITRIFDRYYRISKDQLGSGVGLALVKSLTQLHKGDIYVFSERYKGTEIIIGIPLGEENYADSEWAAASIEQDAKAGARLEAVDNSVLLPLADQESDKNLAIVRSHKHILLVDDNPELRLFFKQAFEKQYHVYEAEDGQTAIELASNRIPDLIISDVMMPGMSGMELCKLIKEKFETSHIPFIILSAKDALAARIEGMESGADFYFGKPLSVDLLLLTVHNIFEQSERLKLRYTRNYLSEATELVHSEKDKAFFNKLLKIIEDNIQDTDLDVDFLCRHMFISRTKLYQKIKSTTDQSVADFIRTIRLKKAIHIMTHEDTLMNKVADRVGLQSSSNFARAFKKEYGKSPLQFMQSLKKGNLDMQEK